MARSLTPENAYTIFGGLLIAAVVGGMGYLYFVRASIPAAPLPASPYSSSVIETELQQPPESNVFLKTTKLEQPVANQENNVTYQPGELGKSNLSQLGQ
jgi:hypothetical protein